MNHRKSRTRTLIQLGGLLTKTRFLDLFDINLGDDLQTEDAHSTKALMLMGLLKDLSDQLPDAFTSPQCDALKEKGLITIRKM